MQAEATVKTIDRAAAILKLLGQRALEGWRLSDLARETGLGKTTTHRLLSALVAVGFAAQDSQTRRYHLGFEVVRLGSAANRYEILDLARPAVLRLARESEDTVFLSVPDGLEAVCVDRAEGAFPIKTLTLDVGARRPLGVGAGSLALLAFRSPEEVAEILESIQPRLANYPDLTPERIQDMVGRARQQGYTLNDGRIVKGMSAIGVPVRDPHGRIVAALSIAAISDRMRPDRVARLAAMLKAEAATLGARLAGPEVRESA